MTQRIALALLFCSVLVTGCAQAPRLPAAPRLLAQVAAAPQRPVELAESQRRDVLKTLEASPAPAARTFANPDLRPEVWAAFWRSPVTSQVDPDRLLLVRYADDGTYVYIGFARDGTMFTDGTGGLLMEPPWSP
ncbi:MAG TPA: hypothetical protein VGI81_08860 [Tepidisphaeraceae bacterium]